MPCRSIAPLIEQLKESHNIQKVDVDSERDLVIKYGVRSIPTFIKVDENGDEKGRTAGVQSKESLLNFFGS